MKKFCVLFAGPIGSSKSPIANYLSYKLNVPVFNNDIIRTEVREDLQNFDADEYDQRRAQRIEELVNSGKPFIYDASIDRKWKDLGSQLIEKGYMPFIISLDISKDKLLRLYEAKNYSDLEALNRTYDDHQRFMQEFKDVVGLSIGDNQFADRLNLSLRAIEEFIGK